MMTGGTRESGRDIIMQIIKIAVPITIAASIMPLVNLADVVIVKYRLAAFCSEAEAEALFGQLTSFAAPIIGFPQIIIQAFVMSIVPMISESNRLGDHERFRRDIYNSYKMSMTIALPCAVGMFVLASPVLALFYMRQQESALNAAPSLQIYAVSFIFLAILSISTAILQGLGKQTIPVRNLFLGMLIKIGVTWLLTGVEVINVRGAAIGTVCAYMFAAVMDVLAVQEVCEGKAGHKERADKTIRRIADNGRHRLCSVQGPLHGGRKLPGTYVHSNSDRCSGIRIHRTENKDDNIRRNADAAERRETAGNLQETAADEIDLPVAKSKNEYSAKLIFVIGLLNFSNCICDSHCYKRLKAHG